MFGLRRQKKVEALEAEKKSAEILVQQQSELMSLIKDLRAEMVPFDAVLLCFLHARFVA